MLFFGMQINPYIMSHLLIYCFLLTAYLQCEMDFKIFVLAVCSKQRTETSSNNNSNNNKYSVTNYVASRLSPCYVLLGALQFRCCFLVLGI